MKRIALIAVSDGSLFLLGRRRDNGKYTLPGGSVEEGETWEEGALRELHEETGLSLKNTPDGSGKLELIRELQDDHKQLRLYYLKVRAQDGAYSDLTVKNDPDREVEAWSWWGLADGGVPKGIADNLAGPRDPDRNILLLEYGLAKSSKKQYEWHTTPDLVAHQRVGYENYNLDGGDPELRHVPIDLLDHTNFDDPKYRDPQVARQAAVLRPGIKSDYHHVTNLASSMKRGPMPPAMAYPLENGRYDISDGGHRLTAAKRLGVKTVPVLVWNRVKMGKAESDLTQEAPSAKTAPVKKRKAKPLEPQDSLVGVHNLTAANLQHAHELGGLVAPSLAVTHRDNPLENFGEISLVANHHLVDPAREPVFDADVYSPRHPRAKHHVNYKALGEFRKWIQPHAAAVGSYFGDAENEINREGADWGTSHYGRRRALGRAFLAEKGLVPPDVSRTAQLQYPWAGEKPLRDFHEQGWGPRDEMSGSDWMDSPHYAALSDAARQSIDSWAKQQAAGDPEIESVLRDSALDQHFSDGKLNFNVANRLGSEIPRAGTTEHDPHATGEQVEEALKAHPDFEDWARNKTANLVSGKYLPQYIDTQNGPSERKLPYTPENILKQMTKTIRQGENFNYGLGSVRSLGAKKFKNLEQMQAARGQIVAKEKFDKLKEQSDERFGKLAEQLEPYRQGGGFGSLDAAADALGQSFRRGRSLSATLREAGYRNVPPALVAELHAFGQDLRSMPTEYFEAKPQRLVRLNEFKGAAVPHDAPQHVWDALQHHGLEAVPYDKTVPGARAEAIRNIASKSDLFLSEDRLSKSDKEEDLAEASKLVRAIRGGTATSQDIAAGLHMMTSGKISPNSFMGWELGAEIAKSPKIDEDTARRFFTLYNDPNNRDQIHRLKELAFNPSTPPDVQERLSDIPETYSDLARNPNLRPDLANKIFDQVPIAQLSSGMREVGKALAKSPHLSPDRLDQFVHSALNSDLGYGTAVVVGQAAAANPNLPEETRKLLVGQNAGRDASTRELLAAAAATNPRLTSDEAHRIISTGSHNVIHSLFGASKLRNAEFRKDPNEPWGPHPILGAEHVARGLEVANPSVLKHPLVTPEQLTAYYRANPNHREEVLGAPALKAPLLNEMISDYESHEGNRGISPFFFTQRAKDFPESRTRMLSSPVLGDEAFDQLRHSMTPAEWHTALRHTIGPRAVAEPKMPQSVLDEAVKSGGLSGATLLAAARSAKNPETIRHLANNTLTEQDARGLDYWNSIEAIRDKVAQLPPDDPIHAAHDDFKASFQPGKALLPGHPFVKWAQEAVPGSFPHKAGDVVPHVGLYHDLAANPNLPPDVQSAIASHNQKLALQLLKNPSTTPDNIRKIVQSLGPMDRAKLEVHPDKWSGPLSNVLANNPNTPSDILDQMVQLGSFSPRTILKHPNASPEALRAIADNPKFDQMVREDAKKTLSLHHPDATHHQSVHVSFGTNKLRKIRDYIMSKGRTEMSPKELPPGDWSAGRNAAGNIAVDKLQAAIDAAPRTRYNVSHDVWEGAQRHSEQPSKVFQLNMTNDQVNKLKEQGVWNTFRKFHDATMQSGHPVTPTTLGWVRYTDNSGEDPTENPNASYEEREERWRHRLGLELERHGSALEDAKDDLPADNVETCPTCYGSGTQRVGDHMDELEDVECPDCGGSGEKVDEDVLTRDQAQDMMNDYDKFAQGDFHPHQHERYKPFIKWARQHVPNFAAELDEPPSREPPVKREVSKSNGPRHVFVDEVQSDFGQSFSKQLAADARRKADEEADAQGMNAEEREAHRAKWMQDAKQQAPEFNNDDDYQKISNVLFGGKKANEVLGEAFLQHLRDKGHHDAKVQIHTTKSKAPISLSRPDAPVPGHFKHTYEEMPKKFGFEPSEYGKLEGQDNSEMRGAPTHEGTVRKVEPAGYKIDHSFWGEGNNRMTVIATAPDGSEVGRTDIDVHPEHLHVAGVFTEEPHRRRGLATAMFQHAEREAKKPISLENTVMTQSGKKFVSRTPWVLAKMAIADMRPGVPSPRHDVQHVDGGVKRAFLYDHYLTPEQRAAGYQIVLKENPHKVDTSSYHDQVAGRVREDMFHAPNTTYYSADLLHQGVPVGNVTGYHTGDMLTPHSMIVPEHRGKGLSKPLYEAVYSHAMRQGAKTVVGGPHSEAASHVHNALAIKHGLGYEAGPQPAKWADLPEYEYALKSELEKGAMQRLAPFDPQKAKAAPAGHTYSRISNKRVDETVRDRIGARAGGDANAREVLSEQGMEPAARMRALHKLHGHTEVRRGPAGREFLLHRGMGLEERDALVNDSNYQSSDASTWTPHFDQAKRFQSLSQPTPVSAWIPEDAIRFDMKQHGSFDSSPGVYHYAPEYELIVAPGKYNLHKPVLRKNDEVSRLLLNPQPAERLMALKLRTVSPHHLAAAFRDEDVRVVNAALAHPAVDHDALMQLMRQPGNEKVALRALSHPAIGPEHLEALYETSHAGPNGRHVVKTLRHHDHLGHELIDRMAKDGHGILVVDNLRMRPDTLAHLVDRHLADPTDQDARQVARRAVVHPACDPAVARAAFKNGARDVQLAVASGPHMPQSEALDVLTRGQLPAHDADAALRLAIVRSPSASKTHLEQGSRDRNSLVRQEASNKLNRDFHKAASAWLDDIKKSQPDDSHILEAQSGHRSRWMNALEAAKFLTGRDPDGETVRSALWQSDGNPERAALIAVGLEETPENLRALRGVASMMKSQSADSLREAVVEPGAPEATEVAQLVQRGFRDEFVVPVKLGGKHSSGTLLVRDPDTREAWLLKPGSGQQDPAAGSAQQPASQSRREAAFYQVVIDWGLSAFYPEAELLLINQKEYAALRLLPWSYKGLDKMDEDGHADAVSTLEPLRPNGMLHRLAAVDYVLGNPDRHAGNIMARDGDVKLIDHGSALSGVEFQPAHDQNTFVPFYLRYTAPAGFGKMTPEQKLSYMPRVNAEVASSLKTWVESINQDQMAAILSRYGVDARGCLERLAKLKQMVMDRPADEAINQAWVAG